MYLPVIGTDLVFQIGLVAFGDEHPVQAGFVHRRDVAGLGVQRIGCDQCDAVAVVVVVAVAVVVVVVVVAAVVVVVEAGQEVGEVGDLVVFGVDVQLCGDAAVGDVVGREQVRGFAGGVLGAVDGFAVHGQMPQRYPAGVGFLTQPGAQRRVGLRRVDSLDRAFDGLQAGRVVPAGPLVAP